MAPGLQVLLVWGLGILGPQKPWSGISAPEYEMWRLQGGSRSGISAPEGTSLILERIFRSGVISGADALRSGISPADPASYILDRRFRSRAFEAKDTQTPDQQNLDPGGHDNLDLGSRAPASKGCPIVCR